MYAYKINLVTPTFQIKYIRYYLERFNSIDSFIINSLIGNNSTEARLLLSSKHVTLLKLKWNFLIFLNREHTFTTGKTFNVTENGLNCSSHSTQDRVLKHGHFFNLLCLP